ncbi:MAG TPA: SGNH/GDSL hydrolase family protein [Acidimicrobiia bacterium]|nr:SGNH/GDSL hydrolase family protein [Acidimicrobiia bacterium]
MGLKQKFVAALPLAAAAVVAGEIVRAARRPELPSFPNQDPTGSFGDPANPSLRIVALGDSSITAPGVEDLDDVWIRTVARAFSDRYRVDLVSLAVGGSKARDVIEGQIAEAVRLSPHVVSVSVGGNDALRGTGRRRFESELEEIVQRLEAAGAVVVLYGMGDLGSIPRLPPTLSRMATRRSEQFDRICRRIAVAHPRTIKVHTRGRILDAFREDPSLFAGDQFHAGGRGHSVFAEEALPAFEAAVEMAMSRR